MLRIRSDIRYINEYKYVFWSYKFLMDPIWIRSIYTPTEFKSVGGPLFIKVFGIGFRVEMKFNGFGFYFHFEGCWNIYIYIYIYIRLKWIDFFFSSKISWILLENLTGIGYETVIQTQSHALPFPTKLMEMEQGSVVTTFARNPQ
jgi:hypothetical protein